MIVFSSNIGNTLHFTIEDVTAEGEQVVARYTVRGTNSGDAYPSNRQAGLLTTLDTVGELTVLLLCRLIDFLSFPASFYQEARNRLSLSSR